ncbi:DUF1254 domain-containing protein [Glutamicibacter sp.]|uniref:DUF1254 domain-containing protein n=1 Tax=Glutamicibacter sp. TaxID=1931995 RepID=UPI0028BDAE72|nr:DUF1254 domain-containing protein [Glutamicibacter sp.]
MGIPVSIDNFTRAESNTMIDRLLKTAGSEAKFFHDRELAPLDRQPVIRQNRDTLYSFAIVDVTDGAKLTIPETGQRYLSVMVINQNHYINQVFHSPGTYALTKEEFDTDYVVVAARILFDPADPADLDSVHAVQDGLLLHVGNQKPFENPEYDQRSHQEVRDALLVLGNTVSSLAGSFGRKENVDPIRHLVGTALGWGGLPDAEASYINVSPRLPQGKYEMTFTDVPADAFWSLSVYNGEGYFEPGDDLVTNVNSVFGDKNDDGSVTVRLGDWADGTANRIQLPEGWNLLIRLYRPRLVELEQWQIPEIKTV